MNEFPVYLNDDFFVFAIADDFKMTIWYQLWSSKLENTELKITVNRFTKKDI